MFSYVWPIALVVLSNVVYQICAKSVPRSIDPFASLTITYTVGALTSGVIFLLRSRGGSLVQAYSHANWAPFVLGFAIVGLEVGFLYAYQAGWPVSTAAVVQSSFLAVALLAVGALLYRETLTWNKVVGVAVVLAGLGLINLR